MLHDGTWLNCEYRYQFEIGIGIGIGIGNRLFVIQRKYNTSFINSI